MKRPLLSLLLVSMCSFGCSSGNGDDGIDTPLDPNVAPVTVGNWYRPTTASTWQWQLKEKLNTDYDVEIFDIDLFDIDEAQIASLQEDGKKVICYFSAGSSEDWRNDFDQFKEDDMGGPLDDWEGEHWLDIRLPNVHEIMLSRLDLAVLKGCDGVEPDNVDGYANDTWFSLNYDDQLAFNRFLSNAAHERGLAVGLKNDGGQVKDLVDYYDFELNEECHQFDECEELSAFKENGKPILNAEYAGSLSEAQAMAETICPAAIAADIRTLILPLDLADSFRISCDEQ
ncbi:MAG: endo alpha-1,4 polygalactosaminidase [Deltaproteobacteria bacterium]|nr:endo alpha-1,4 polygalactosaminidase [Deltaproteobacteria bacterium]